MTERDPALIAAEERASAARGELHAALTGAFGWFAPQRLKEEAAIAATQQIDEAKAALRRSASRHPLATWSAIAALTGIAGYVLRRPAASLTRVGINAVHALRKRLARRK